MVSERLHAGVEAGVAPGPDQVYAGLVLAAAGIHGQKDFLRAYGRRLPDAASPALTEDDTFWFASCTKLVTTVAVLQCVERGLFALDSADDVQRLCPALRDVPVLQAMRGDPASWTTQPATAPVTLRQLLTHSSGFGYDFKPPLLFWRQAQGHKETPIVRAFESYLQSPREFDTGCGWTYGIGVDIAGQLLEQATGVGLDEYCAQHIFHPLGMKSMHFRLIGKTPSDIKPLPLAFRKHPNEPLIPAPESFYQTMAEQDWACGGAGLYGTAGDYIKLLKSLLLNDGRVLQTKSVDVMFEPQIEDTTELEAKYNDAQMSSVFTPGIKAGTQKWNFGLGGKLLQTDVPGRFKRGTMSWGGAPNQRWWIDRATGTCGFLGAMLMPTGELRCVDLANLFEEEVHKHLGKTDA